MHTLLPLLGGVLLTGSVAGVADPDWPSTVKGYGLTVEGAKKDAVKETVRRLGDHVRRLDPPLMEWKPSEEFVEKNLLDGPGSSGGEVKIADIEHGTSWIFRLKTPDLGQLARLERQAIGARRLAEREAVSRERSMFAALAFGAILSSLALTMAYIHLAERGRK